jgi:hypothetical protein
MIHALKKTFNAKVAHVASRFYVEKFLGAIRQPQPPAEPRSVGCNLSALKRRGPALSLNL